MARFEKIGGLEGLILVHPKRIGDERGFFAETFRQSEFAAHGIDCQFVQSNHSLSQSKGTLRGLHFQKAPHAQAKLVQCIAGSLLDVVVDPFLYLLDSYCGCACPPWPELGGRSPTPRHQQCWLKYYLREKKQC